MDRRDFVRQSSTAVASVALSGVAMGQSPPAVNPLPKWRGFNLLDFFSPNPQNQRDPTRPEFFKWMVDWGFDFVRIPMAYPSYIKFDRTKSLEAKRACKMDKRAVERVDLLIERANQVGLHVSLNLHRAPGFCVNAGFTEPYNLWYDEEAMEDFCRHWKFWAKRYRSKSRQELSFDLLNEPCLREDMNDQHSKRSAVPGPKYRAMVLNAMEVILRYNKDRIIMADGNNVGSEVIPEITDLDIGQSCRGYHPGIISHFRAPWAVKDPDSQPVPSWPGQIGGRTLNRQMLEEFYAPWIALTQQGIGVHCGECGCYNKTPHDVFLAWFADVLDVLGSNGIGFALWEFRGSFGILNSGRKDVDYEDWYGYKLDRKLLQLLQAAV
ncbi:MAG: cellulase family glycosylhydrolase [Saprospiraceae bacterium]|nr:cellulase family glycosylhydrolase [Saprospiraceae bacterium]